LAPGTGPFVLAAQHRLQEGNSPSPFLVPGPDAELRPQLLRRMVTEGHEIGNHAWNHRSYTSLSPSRIRREIDRTSNMVAQAVGQPATFLHPPFGAHNSTSDWLSSWPVVLWDVDTLDWKHRNTERVVGVAVKQTKPGSIVLMHGIHPSTVAAVQKIFSGLRDKDYTFVTVAKFMGPSGFEAGKSSARDPQSAKPDNGERGKAGRGSSLPLTP
jgi:peptidoglycan/xylan/chitin deacetylase (PgdA/CDA1 family)